MKKWFIWIAAAVVLSAGGCKEEPPTEKAVVTEDAVSVTPKDEVCESKGGSVEVVVTSSGNWALTGEYDWATPSAKKGSDGAVVKFTVAANETEADKTAEFTFTVGKKTALLKIVSKAPEAKKNEPTSKLELLSDKELTVSREKQKFEIELSTDVNYRELECSVPEEAAGWLKYVITTQSGETVKMHFEVALNESYENRSAEVTVKGGDAEAKFSVTQKQTDKLELDKNTFFVPLEGGDVDITVITNVEYDVVVKDGADSWLTVPAAVDSKYTFKVPAFGEKRVAAVTFTSKDGALSQTATITQKAPALISTAASMTKNRAWPMWHNPDPVTGMTTFTMEALVNANSFRKSSSPLSILMGIEGKFLVRFGDVMIPQNQLQVCYYREGSPYEQKLTGLDMQVDPGEWHHIAVTYDRPNKTIKVFIDGEEKGSTTGENLLPVNFGVPHSDESGYSITRCFWVGYAYEEHRYFDGTMSEVRIWNKALTQEDLQAPNHFYNVAPDSDGLVAYWKFNDGKTGAKDVVKDHTSYGNHLSTDTGIEWVEVSLP